MPAPARRHPRWFTPALIGGILVATAGLGTIATLSSGSEAEQVAVGGRSLVIPASHVTSLAREPHLFVRIKPPDKPFDIVHDSRGTGRHDRTGVPHIFSVNDAAQHDVWYARDERTLVVCRRASSPVGGCGTWLTYGGARWSILFPESRIREADRFVREATTILRTYDRASGRLIL
jgi:hypothetical protein